MALAANTATLWVTDDRIREETDKSGSMRKLKALIKDGFPEPNRRWTTTMPSTSW